MPHNAIDVIIDSCPNLSYIILVKSIQGVGMHIERYSLLRKNVTIRRTWLWQYPRQYTSHELCTRFVVYCVLSPVPLTIFRSNSKFDQIWPCSGLKCTLPIATKFCTGHNSVTIVTCSNFRCHRLSTFQTIEPPIYRISNLIEISLVGRVPGMVLYQSILPISYTVTSCYRNHKDYIYGNVNTKVLDKFTNTIQDVKIKPKIIRCNKTYTIAHSKIQQKGFLIRYVKPAAQLLFKVDFQNMDKRTRGKWLIYDTKRCNDNHLQSLKLPYRIS